MVLNLGLSPRVPLQETVSVCGDRVGGGGPMIPYELFA